MYRERERETERERESSALILPLHLLVPNSEGKAFFCPFFPLLASRWAGRICGQGLQLNALEYIVCVCVSECVCVCARALAVCVAGFPVVLMCC